MTIFGTLWPKQNNPVIWLRHNGENKHLATHLSVYILDMLVMDLFPIFFTQNHYFCFYFFTLAFYFVPILDYWDKRGVYTCKLSADAGSVLPVLNHLTLCYRSNVASLHCNDWVWPTERQTRIIIKLKELNVAFSVCVFWVCISSLYYDCTHTHRQTHTHAPFAGFIHHRSEPKFQALVYGTLSLPKPFVRRWQRRQIAARRWLSATPQSVQWSNQEIMAEFGGRVLESQAWSKTPSTGVPHPSSSHCHNWSSHQVFLGKLSANKQFFVGAQMAVCL